VTTDALPKPALALLRERVFRHYWSAHVVSIPCTTLSRLAG
jgi:hypothetical protein